jgi:hypothetical protein
MTFNMERCDYCAQSARNADSGLTRANCRGCTVRGFAEGLLFFEAKRVNGRMPEYWDAVKATFGDAWEQAHKEIKAEAARIMAFREAKKQERKAA